MDNLVQKQMSIWVMKLKSPNFGVGERKDENKNDCSCLRSFSVTCSDKMEGYNRC